MEVSNTKKQKFLHSTVISLSAVAAGLIVKKGMDMIYEKIYRQDPPDQKSDENVNLLKFLAYSVITGIAINLVKDTVMRSGTVLNNQEQQHLVNSLFACKESTLTPFNRPIFITLTVDELDKKFM